MSARAAEPSRSPAGPGQDNRQDTLRDLDLLTADDVCVLFKVKKSWLYDTVEAGEIEVVRLGKQLRFQPSAVSAYLAERTEGRRAAETRQRQR